MSMSLLLLLTENYCFISTREPGINRPLSSPPPPSLSLSPSLSLPAVLTVVRERSLECGVRLVRTVPAVSTAATTQVSQCRPY